jgi:preprotein translocase subunit SecE
VTNSKAKTKLTPADAGKRVTRWFREMRSELKKVVWPTRKQLTNNMLIAIVMMLISGVVIGAFDYLAKTITLDVLINRLGTLVSGLGA